MGNKPSRQAAAAQQALDTLLARPSALHPRHFALHATAHHGVPSNARALAYCGRQGILAVGTASGAVKLFGADGLEVLLEAPETPTHLALGVTHLQFSAKQRLVTAYSDSSIRVFDLDTQAPLTQLPGSWTTSVITSLETISYTDFPFFFVATDDGDIHVVHEETGRASTYVIRQQDLSVPGAEGVTAMASHPRDSNLLLLAYDTCPAVLMWDFSKRKVVREFTLSGKLLKSPQASLSPSESSSLDGGEASTCNSPQSLSWHSSGKRFVAGFKNGGFAIFRVDKSHGLYRYATMPQSPADQLTPLKQIKWVCAPPSSRLSHLPGAIVFFGGRREASESNLLSIVYPPCDGRSGDDALTDLFKADKLTWSVASVESANHGEISAFVSAHDQVDFCAKMAPLSLILLSGNPLDGVLPTVSVQCLPCFVKLCDGDKEEWEWQLDRLPDPAIIPPFLQLSPLKTLAVVNLSTPGSFLQDDLVAAWEQHKHDPMFRLLHSGDFEWPLNGGSILEPMLKGFIAASGALDSDNGVAPNSTLLLSGHANGYILFWEAQSAADRVSKGAIQLLHVVDIPQLMAPAPVNTEITCVAFCVDSRTLVVGFASGEMAVLEFTKVKEPQTSVNGEEDNFQEAKGENDDSPKGLNGKEKNGFRMLFSTHVHSEPILKIALSTAYNYVAIADAVGMVSLIHLKTQAFQLLVCDIAPASDESLSVDSMLMSELVQITEIPGSSSSPSASLPGDGKTSPLTKPFSGSSGGNTDTPSVVQHREVIPILFVGRGSGKLEMYHVQSATKIGETVVDQQKANSLSSLIMITEDGERVQIPGRRWTERDDMSVDGSLDAVESEELGVKSEQSNDVNAPASEEAAPSDLHVSTENPKDKVQPQFLVCTCGKAIHVMLAAVPSAADIAMGPKEIPAQPLASVELAGPVLVTSIVRVPVGEGVENCLAAVDQSNRVYIISLISLKLIWEADCNSFDFGLGRSGLVDGVLAEISFGGELIVANSFGEMKRFSLFAEHTAMENAMLECKSIKTRVHLPERAIVFDQAASPSTDSGKKRGIAADAGKMFKKLVQRVTEETVDLNKVFQFSTEEDERKRLMGDRTAASAKDSAAAENDAAKIEHGTNATKDALMQAQQRLAERGEKLSELGLKTEQMKKTSEDFYQTMKAFNEKNANKKWYEF